MAALAGGVVVVAAAVEIGTDGQALKGESSAAHRAPGGLHKPPGVFFEQQESAERRGAGPWRERAPGDPS